MNATGRIFIDFGVYSCLNLSSSILLFIDTLWIVYFVHCFVHNKTGCKNPSSLREGTLSNILKASEFFFFLWQNTLMTTTAAVRVRVQLATEFFGTLPIV